MSKNETWRTRKYWESVGGLLVEEFVAVNPGKNQGKRSFDGVIVLEEESKIFDGNFFNVEGKDIIVIQTKSSRLSMSLLGQAFFSRSIMEKHKPKSIKTIVICGKSDDILFELAEKENIEVIEIKDKL